MSRRVIFLPDDYWTNPPKENTVTNDKPPRDVVPPTPRTREEILNWNALVGTTVNFVQPGEVIAGPDGFPVGMTPNETYPAPLTKQLQVFRDQLDAVGLTEDDVPNLTVIDRKEN